MRASLWMMVCALMLACGSNKECTETLDPGLRSCETDDDCAMTCVCEGGVQVEAGLCAAGTCSSPTASCTECPKQGLGDWTGEFCIP